MTSGGSTWLLAIVVFRDDYCGHVGFSTFRTWSLTTLSFPRNQDHCSRTIARFRDSGRRVFAQQRRVECRRLCLSLVPLCDYSLVRQNSSNSRGRGPRDGSYFPLFSFLSAQYSSATTVLTISLRIESRTVWSACGRKVKLRAGSRSHLQAVQSPRGSRSKSHHPRTCRT